MGDILVLAVLGVIIGLVIRSMWKNHKSGKSCGCSGNCTGCQSGKCNCHTEQ